MFLGNKQELTGMTGKPAVFQRSHVKGAALCRADQDKCSACENLPLASVMAGTQYAHTLHAADIILHASTVITRASHDL